MIRCNQCEKISNCPYGIQDCESIISTCDEFYFNLAEHDKQIRANAIDEFVRWAYVHGIDFSFMGKIKDDGTSDVPERLQKIKNDFWEQLKEQKNE